MASSFTLPALLPHAGAQKKPYVWDAAKGRLRAVDPHELEEGRGGVGSSERYGRSLLGHWHRIGHDLSNAFFPDPLNVTPGQPGVALFSQPAVTSTVV